MLQFFRVLRLAGFDLGVGLGVGVGRIGPNNPMPAAGFGFTTGCKGLKILTFLFDPPRLNRTFCFRVLFGIPIEVYEKFESSWGSNNKFKNDCAYGAE